MARSLPPLNALQSFEAAARLGSISAGAEELHVTHGAISRQVRVLEDWVGVRLFERAGRRVRLTEAGRAYLDAVRPALDGIAEATRRLTDAGGDRALAVNALPTFTMRWLLPRLTRFQRRRPGVELRLVSSDQPLAGAGGFDVAIRRGPGPWPGCVATPFLSEWEIPVCSPKLLAERPIKRPADLARHTLLHAETRPDAWRRWLAAAGVPRLAAERQRFDHFYLALQAASDGLGVALGPLPILADDLAAGRLVAPLPGPLSPARGYVRVVPETRARDPVVRAFCAWLDEEGAASPAPV
jgi:LysR family glycine cleavage system transcriptional activator